MSAMAAAIVARLLVPRRVRVVAISVLLVAGGLLAASFATADRGRTAFGTDLGHDFAGFYVAGKILNEYGADWLYDRRLHHQLYHELLPHLPPTTELPFWHPPFVALLFRPLAALPYSWAFALWLLVSLGACVAGLRLALTDAAAIPKDARGTAWLLALSFQPFIMAAWIGGQLSAFALLFLALALHAERRGHSVAGGVALGMCLYKPPLLALALPMLLAGRRWRMVAGAGAAALALATGSALALGPRANTDYLHVLTGALGTTTSPQPTLASWNYVDLVTFVRLLLGGHTTAGWLLIGALGALALAQMLPRWWRGAAATPEGRRALWAGTITATSVVNLYFGVYDVTIVIIGAILTADVLLRRTGITPHVALLLMIVYVIPWFSPFIAILAGVQLTTLALAAFAIAQFRLFDAMEARR